MRSLAPPAIALALALAESGLFRYDELPSLLVVEQLHEPDADSHRVLAARTA